MLAIRMQRTGRKGHAMFRMVVQESRLTPTSGKVVARLGNYDPHGKTLVVDKEKASFYLEHGAQPSERVVHLLKTEGVVLPKWVKTQGDKKREVRSPEKRRSTSSAIEPEAASEETQTSSDTPTEPAVNDDSSDLTEVDSASDTSKTETDLADPAEGASDEAKTNDAAPEDNKEEPVKK